MEITTIIPKIVPLTNEQVLLKGKMLKEGIPFFMRNDNWYYYDDKQKQFVLTDAAPREAVESYEDFINENPYEPKEQIDNDNPYEYQDEEDKDNPYK